MVDNYDDAWVRQKPSAFLSFAALIFGAFRFSWPDTPMMNGIQGASLDSLYSQNVPGLHQGFGYQGLGSFHPTEVPLN